MSRHYALIPAAGSGTRMGVEIPKQYLPLNGRPMIHYALAALCRHPRITRVVVVLAPDDALWDTHDWSAFADKLTVLRCGGAQRCDTVNNGLAAMQGEAGFEDWVLVHDAARPCLNAALIDKLLAEVGDDPFGGLLALPVADTLKRADDAVRAVRTEARDGLWQAQTPQMFRFGLLQRALSLLAGDVVTDEAQAVERLGFDSKLVASDSSNFKVTYPRDLKLAEWLLREEA
jgi:2-C-methyl-D-erythritol 4-phosphate cytidylyltransferase